MDTTLPAIVAQLGPSPEQIPAILARGSDVVVTAGAGTGKTRTLVARYLALVAEDVPLRSIAAITFTKKAAREMRNRVREQVRRYVEQPGLPEEQRRKWDALYNELDAARIGTIHSLCTELLQAHPAEAGVDPRFNVLSEGMVNILRRLAVAETLAWAAQRPQGVLLLQTLRGRGLHDTLDALLQRRLDAGPALEALPERLWPAWEARVAPMLCAFIEEPAVQSAFAGLLALRADGTLVRAAAAGDGLAAPLQRLLALWDEICAAARRANWVAVSSRLAALRAEMKQVGRKDNWRPADPKAAIKLLQDVYDASLKPWVGSGIDLGLDRRLAEILPALREAYRFALQRYEHFKYERQALDFDDLEAHALRLLREHPAARAAWQQTLRAILVDEFQDTNARQRDLVRLLNGDGGRMFVVGDAKQSIYRFRGADVSVFREERDKIEGAHGAAYALQVSYRAHHDLVASLNALLCPILGDHPDPARPWAEPFAPLAPHRERPDPGFEPPHIELHLGIGSKQDGALRRAADGLAARLVELVESGGVQVIDDGGQARPIEYGDIAILCRASRSFEAYEDALERAGVRFLTVAGRGFYARPEIRDVLNALKAIADPSDDLALIGLLRSPAFAVPDDALYMLQEMHHKNARTRSLWSILPQIAAALPDPAAARVLRAVRIVDELHARAGRSTVADLLKAFLDASAYRAALLHAGQTRAARNVAKLLADANASNAYSAGEFLDYVAALRDSGTREGEARATAEGAVQLMTVHSAKGLEFPVVVIGDAGSSSRPHQGLLIDPQLGVLLPLRDEALPGEGGDEDSPGDSGTLPALYRLAMLRESDQEAAERDRLLYVAATRVREKLIISGCLGARGGSARAGSARLTPTGWLKQLHEAGLAFPLEYAASGPGTFTLQVAGLPARCIFYAPAWAGARRAAGEAQNRATDAGPDPAMLAALPAPARLPEEAETPERVWQVVPQVERPRAPAWVIGSLVHAALAAWRFPPEASRERDDEFARWVASRARGYGLADAHQLADAVRSTRELMRRFYASALRAEMESAGQRLHEVPYSILRDGRLETGVIDALYLRDGAWTLVEFKTDEIRHAGALERHVDDRECGTQVERYVRAASAFLGESPRALVVLLDFEARVLVVQPAG